MQGKEKKRLIVTLPLLAKETRMEKKRRVTIKRFALAW